MVSHNNYVFSLVNRLSDNFAPQEKKGDHMEGWWSQDGAVVEPRILYTSTCGRMEGANTRRQWRAPRTTKEDLRPLWAMD